MSIVFIDLEVNSKNKVFEYGAYIDQRKSYQGNKEGFRNFIRKHQYICGHNVLMHDLKYIEDDIKYAKIKKSIDTLPLSALLFVEKRYHPLVKDYQLNKNIDNKPLIDASLAHTLFYDEVAAFKQLPMNLKMIYYGLLHNSNEFSGFFDFLNYKARFNHLERLIIQTFYGKICNQANLALLIENHPVELAYCLAMIHVDDLTSIAPDWVIHRFPQYYEVMNVLRGKRCQSCDYCNSYIDAQTALKKYFNHDKYRSFNNLNLQEMVVNAQLDHKSIMAVFPTGGGKSITFQIPALMMGESIKGLTIVISPLQSLMNDQVENLKESNINNVGTINGSMNAIERFNTIKRVKQGDIHILYIAPESLRSPSIFKLLSTRNIVRFVIDEAHCFSTWGHDFRVDYQYIAEFIKKIEKERIIKTPIHISCFTATAKKEVIDDIKQYFKMNLNIELETYITNTRRDNLSFFVKRCSNHTEKMMQIKQLLEESGDKSVIIYASRRKASEKIAQELIAYGYNATNYHGGMNIETKNTNQLMFTRGEKNIIVATSAFGMGVDKKDVAYVIHYQVSPTIEDYLQEAGRGGRDINISAKCIVLYDENDIDLHFSLLTQSKLSHREINTLWRTIKKQTKSHHEIIMTAKELARNSGWDEDDYNVVTQVTNSILALEKIDYVKRNENSPRIYASSIVPKSMSEAKHKINTIPNLKENDKTNLSRIMTTLYTDKNTDPQRGAQTISGIDDLYDLLEMEKYELIKYINILKDYGLLNADNDLIIRPSFQGDLSKSSKNVFLYIKIIQHLISSIDEENETYNLKALNTEFEKAVPECSVKAIRLVINYLDALKIIKQTKDKLGTHFQQIQLLKDEKSAQSFIDMLSDLASFIVESSYKRMDEQNKTAKVSMVELKNAYNTKNSLLETSVSLDDVQAALLLIHRIQALLLDGGFLVVYNPMRIEKKEFNPHKQYTQQHYKMFEEHYSQKSKKIHLLTLFLEMLEKNVEKSLLLVDDYFSLEQKDFEKKYVTQEYKKYYGKSITKKQYEKIYGELSEKQKEIIEDKNSDNIVVLAGPGSGKTKLLVHKLASLIDLEDVKLNELLMLTFSRSATIVFKERLRELIGARANYVSIKTFHSYCFDIIGQVGNIDKTDDLFDKAIKKIEKNDVDETILNLSTLVIDEAQDMSEKEYDLIKSLIKHNEKLRLIAVGDDDQNIFEFRGSDSRYMMQLSDENSKNFELLINYRSLSNIVDFSQSFALKIKNRFKEGFIESYAKNDGSITLIKYRSENIFESVVKQIQNIKTKDISVGLLTYKNEDAEIMSGLLTKEGINNRLIQSNKSFRLDFLYEFDWFLNQFDKDMPVITEETWVKTKELFYQEFKPYSIYPYLLDVIHGFEVLFPNKKFLLDLEEHIKESKIEDLYMVEKNQVIVSTIHKSKGREFDAVFLILSNTPKESDYRALYVALTRAKSHLVIHTNQNVFDDIECQNMKKYYDESLYDMPDELVIQLFHEDINLSSSKYCRNQVPKVSTDSILTVDEDGCMYNGKKVLYFSKATKELIEKKAAIKYVPIKASVTYKVKWYDKENDETYWLVLPKIYFKHSDEVSIEELQEV